MKARDGYVPLTNLTEYEFQPQHNPMDMLLRRDPSLPCDGLDLNPPYQRQSVWTLEQRRNLIKSVLQRLPIGAIFINDRGDWVRRVVDGKQRIETFDQFFNDEFSVPSEWINPQWLANATYGKTKFSDLGQAAQRFFMTQATCAVYWTKLRTLTEEEELYERINYGGTPHER